ncbi:hypothetical protein ACM9HF_02320 [Colwellia sp. RE-S-Sl-9]
MTEKNNEEFFEKVREHNQNLSKNQKKIRNFSSSVAGISASIALAITASMTFNIFFDSKKILSNDELTNEVSVQNTQVKGMYQDLSNLQDIVTLLKSKMDSVEKFPEGTEWKSEIIRLEEKIDSISIRVTEFENAITADPLKALAVPILRKDLDNVRSSLNTEIRQSKAEIDRIYDQNKWFIGLLFSIAISVLGMVITNYVNSKKDT